MNLTKEYLRTASTDDLRALANECGLLLPVNLNRRFIISELFDWIAEAEHGEAVSLINLADAPAQIPLPDSYNCTEISALVRDPMWLFVFWDFHAELYDTLLQQADFETFLIRVHSLSPEEVHVSKDSFDITVAPDDRQRYIFVSFEEQYNMVELCARMKNGFVTILAKSPVLHLERPNLPHNLCVSQNEASKIALLSGLREVKTFHFRNYRQAFRAD